MLNDLIMVVEVLNTVGFPIFISLLLLWWIKESLLKFRLAMELVNSSITNNTKSIDNLINKLDK